MTEVIKTKTAIHQVRGMLWKYRGLYLCLWMFLGCAVPIGWLAYQVFGPRPAFVISKQTTRFTEPLRADGYLDFPQLLKDRYSASNESPAETLMMQVRDTVSGWDPIKKPDCAVGVYGACEHALNVGNSVNEKSGLDPFDLAMQIESQ